MEIKIEQDIIDDATKAAMAKLLSDDNYNNPVKQILEKQFSWNMEGEGNTEFAKQFKLRVVEAMSNLIDSPEFQQRLGDVIINKFADACVKDLRKHK